MILHINNSEYDYHTLIKVAEMAGLAGIVGFFAGAALGDSFGGAILFSMIAGIACVIYAIDNRE